MSTAEEADSRVGLLGVRIPGEQEAANVGCARNDPWRVLRQRLGHHKGSGEGCSGEGRVEDAGG